MKKLNILMGIAAMFLLVACGNNNTADGKEEVDANMDQSLAAAGTKISMVKFPPPVVKADEEPVDNIDIQQKIVKEGDIRFEVDNVADARSSILKSLKKAGGYVTAEQENTYEEVNQHAYTLIVKVPAKNFDTFLGEASSTANHIDTKNISIRDVTTEYIDIKTRLDNKKLLEKRYLSLLEKATQISDVVEIENKLTEIRSDIESTQGQFNYLNKQVAYSTLEITYYVKQAGQIQDDTFGYKIKSALKGGWNLLQKGFFGIIAAWPVWLVIGVVILIIRRRRKSRV